MPESKTGFLKDHMEDFPLIRTLSIELHINPEKHLFMKPHYFAIDLLFTIVNNIFPLELPIPLNVLYFYHLSQSDLFCIYVLFPPCYLSGTRVSK